jgi:O-antigen/teichoic acid export membrane protein
MQRTAESDPKASTTVAGTSTRSSLAFVYVGYAFRYVYLLVLVPFYGRILGAEEYGRLLTAMSLYQIVWTVVEYGLPGGGVRDLATGKQRPAQIYGNQVSARIVTTVPGILMGMLGTWASPSLREAPAYGLFATVAGVVAGYSMGWFFQGTLRFRTSVMLEVAGFSLSFPMILGLVRSPADGWRVLVILTLSTVTVNIIAHTLARKLMSERTPVTVSGAFLTLRETTALFAQRAAVIATSQATVYLVSLFVTASAVGWYGSADRIASVGLSLLLPASQVLVGTVTSKLASADTEQAAFALVRKALVALTGLGIAMLLGAWGLSRWAIPFVLGPGFEPAITVLNILALLFPATAFAQVLGSYLLIPLRYDSDVSKITVVVSVLTIVAVPVLARSSGGEGVAWARVVGAILQAILLLWVAQRRKLLGRVLRLASPKG